MNGNGLMQEVTQFFKAARHLWGRCPQCDSLFRLSEAAISTNPEPPRDWLRRLEKRQADVLEKEGEIELRENEVSERETNVQQREREVRWAEDRLEANSKKRVKEILASNTEMRAVIRQATKEAVLRSRATLLGKLLERLAPCFRKFAYDPRDMRCICDPLDYVLFDGLTTERRVREIVFVEVKCGRSRLSSTQRSIREVIEKRRIHSEVWEIGSPDIPITKQLAASSQRALPAAEQD